MSVSGSEWSHAEGPRSKINGTNLLRNHCCCIQTFPCHRVMAFEGWIFTAFVYIPVPWNEKNQIIKSPRETVFLTKQEDENTELF